MRLRTQNRYTHRASIEDVEALVTEACEERVTNNVKPERMADVLARLVDVLAERGLLSGPDIVRIVGGPPHEHEVDEEQAEVLK